MKYKFSISTKFSFHAVSEEMVKKIVEEVQANKAVTGYSF